MNTSTQERPYRKIPTTQGKFILVDPEDYERMNTYKWQLNKNKQTYYAMRTVPLKDSKKTKGVLFHRAVLQYEGPLLVDHINGDGLDNRKHNIRLCTQQQNCLNRRKQRNASSPYKGVSWSKYRKKWDACIHWRGIKRDLGHFAEEEDAAIAYDVAAQLLHGPLCSTNSSLGLL